MNSNNKFFFTVLIMLCSGSFSAYGDKVPFDQMLQQVVDYYPTLRASQLQVIQAQQEAIKVDSLLSWQIGLNAGVSRDVSLFLGTPTDRLDINGNLNRQLASGNTIGLTAGAVREDAADTFSPLLPNPSLTTNVELNYRHHLAKGANFPQYQQGLLAADAGVVLAQAQQQSLYDQLASTVISSYTAASTTKARMENIKQAIERSRRLQRYIRSRANLGVSERKDILQVNAQLKTREAEYQGLNLLYQQQRIGLNQLMGTQADSPVDPVIIREIKAPEESKEQMLQQVLKHSPALRTVEGRIKLAESTLELRRDAKKSQVDVVLFVGNQAISGDTVTGDVDESEPVGGVRLEYSRSANRRGFDADIYQAQLDRDIALHDRKQIEQDLNYLLASLLAELRTGIEAINAYRESVDAENAKLKEAVQRYRAGRTDTDQIIQFETQLAAAELALELQQVETARRYLSLRLLRGSLWENIKRTSPSSAETTP